MNVITEPCTKVSTLSVEDAWRVLQSIPDPEIPVISITDLGIVRKVDGDVNELTVTVTPTYAGCPATEVIREEIVRALQAAGALRVTVRTQLSPPWTTDWINAAAQTALREYGIAPPCATASDKVQGIAFKPACPRCGSHASELLSPFGATPCKALYRCVACREPFEFFKPI
jgi:ring-1,2-phenylacetyl-CoA epoxidase subunit PaaD